LEQRSARRMRVRTNQVSASPVDPLFGKEADDRVSGGLLGIHSNQHNI
jgi:hypothetical protein